MSRAALILVPMFVLGISAVAQMRSSVTAGGAPGPQHSGVFTRPGGGFHRGFSRGNSFGTVVYPYGLYDGFYEERPTQVVEQPTPVVVIRDERPATPAPATPAVAMEPKMIEVPATVVRTTAGANPPSTAIFILSDGRRLEAQTYTISDSSLTIKELHKPAVHVPLSELNVDATLAANRERGLDLRLPESSNEFLISF